MGYIMEINEALITEVVVIIQEQKEKTGKMEDRRTLQKEMTTYHAVTFVNLFLIGLLIAQKKEMKQKYPCFQMIFKNAVWLSL